MKDLSKWMLFGLFVMIPALPACLQAKPAARSVPARVLRASTLCGTTEAACRLTWISNPDAYARAMNAGRSTVTPEADRQPAPAVDFNTQGILWIEMGMRPSTGYGFDKTSVRAVLEGNTVNLTLAAVTPAPGMIVAQMITSPCILVQLPKGDYSRIRVLDQTGKLLGTLTLF
jgi:hypothetical protein